MNEIVKFLTFLALLVLPVIANAQFTIVDADSKEPLPGVFVFSENGALLTISNEKGEVKALQGKVTLSMMSFEPLTVEADGLHGEVALKPKSFALSEVVVGKKEFVKVSAAFRDVVTNYDKVVLYREGIVDYFYNVKSKKWDRRIRGCRQYEHEKLRKLGEDTVVCWNLRLMDFNKVQTLKTTDSSTAHGDTTMIGAMKGKKEVKDGVMVIEKPGSYRTIIDGMKFANKTSVGFLGLHYTVKKMFMDWTYSQNEENEKSIQSLRTYREEDFQWSKKMPVVPVVTQSDIVVYEVTYHSKQDAKAMMKDKEQTTDFILPDCLPALPQSVIEQGKKLQPKKFHDF